jgi:hypothetical protein
MLSDPIIQETLRAIKAIEELCNRGIKPWEPDAAYRAQCLFRSLAQPYIDTLLDYMSSRPKSAFQIPVFQYDGKLYPIMQVPD